MSGDLFISLNITGWSAGCWVLGPFVILIILLLFGSGWSCLLQLHCHQIRLSQKTGVKAERDVSLKVVRIKFQLPVGHVSCFRSLGLSQLLLPQEAQI